MTCLALRCCCISYVWHSDVRITAYWLFDNLTALSGLRLIASLLSLINYLFKVNIQMLLVFQLSVLFDLHLHWFKLVTATCTQIDFINYHLFSFGIHMKSVIHRFWPYLFRAWWSFVLFKRARIEAKA